MNNEQIKRLKELEQKTKLVCVMTPDEKKEYRELTMKLDTRQKKMISIYRLSRMSGIPESTIRSYENGVSPTVDKADKLTRALGVTLVLGEKEG